MRLKTKLLVDYYVGGMIHASLKPVVILLGRVLHRDHRLDNLQDVTVLKLMGGGSLVVAYPALLAIKRLPHVRSLNLIASPATRAFGELLGIFDTITVIRDQKPTWLIADAAKAIRAYWKTDTLIDLEVHSRLTTVFCLLTSARNRIGFYTLASFWRKGISTHLLFCQVVRGIHHFYDQLAQLMGAQVGSLSDASRRFRAHLELGERPAATSRGEVIVALAPCCSDLGRERMLKIEEWTGIFRARAMRDNAPSRIHLLGSPSDRTYLEEMRQALEQILPSTKVINEAGHLNLGNSVRLLSTIDRLFAIDSSMLHFARLLGVPTVSYWGPTDPESRLRVSDLAADEIHYAHLPCSPCVHVAAEPPCRGNNLCIRFAVNPQHDGNRNPPWLA